MVVSHKFANAEAINAEVVNRHSRKARFLDRKSANDESPDRHGAHCHCAEAGCRKCTGRSRQSELRHFSCLSTL